MKNVENPYGDDVAIDIRGLAAAVWRAKRWILPATVAVAVVTAVVLSLITPRYLGQSKILIEATKSVLADADEKPQEAERALLDPEGVTSQVQLLISRDLARRVAKKLELAERAEFNPAGKGGGTLVGDLMVLFGLARDPLRVSPEERVLEAYYERLKVYNIENSRVIAVEFSSIDPALAARGANTIVDEYMALQSAAKRSKTVDMAEILEPEIAKLRDEVSAAERRVEDFRSSNDLLIGNNNLTLTQQQLGELTTQLASARSAQSEAETKARLVRNLISSDSLDSSTDVLNSRLIQRLRERQVTLKAQLAELSTTLLPNHPRIKALKSQIADFNSQVRGEARKVLRGLENDAEIAAERVRSLQSSINELKAKTANTNNEQVRLRELQRDAEAKSRRLTTLLGRYREADAGRNARTLPVDARVISRATVPPKPYWPKIVPITVIVTIAALLVFIGIVVITEFLSGKALRPVPVAAEDEPEAPEAPEAVGRIPEEDLIRWDDSGNLHRVMPSEPAHAAERSRIESAREVWRRIAPGSDGKRHLVVAGAEPGTATRIAAMALARTASADDNVRVVMLDLSNEIHAGDGITEMPLAGLTDLLDRGVSFAQVLFRDRRSRAHVVPRGRRPLTEADLAGERFQTVMEALEFTYDAVIIDVGPLTFGRHIAEFLLRADHVVLATSGKTGDPTAAYAYEILSRNGIEEISVVSTAEMGDPIVAADLTGAAA
ncbi:uncharacterized protein involved in exopolysaccharide biosynthesis/Mrp family chromosome partitioning ATPase [Rhodobium orientis]|uniref:Polysaccharide chain length determinant N-terminal domain-containing protein n=1 Tax=Rhodobium orientis TaxID=34017 RepID=A0A327JQ15_9HYPH|nr:exopolysaccharide transport family protein [Rhodobium orientis]MBB4304797.1 uncharacterized protein involved in exopolysaccharide biosynthesis/Mrp family chromosome partitioning ATPase [Rhodobium orientis]MBK5948029.1 hypothetical protein [Rhodobium orientis]RAI27464.1 hypothetical protein CH339_10260 [Rhodobium orientis]